MLHYSTIIIQEIIFIKEPKYLAVCVRIRANYETETVGTSLYKKQGINSLSFQKSTLLLFSEYL